MAYIQTPRGKQTAQPRRGGRGKDMELKRTAGALVPENGLPAEQAEDAARVLILGGLDAGADAFLAGETVKSRMQAQDLLVSALDQAGPSQIRWLQDAQADLIALAALRGAQSTPALPDGMQFIGIGESEAMANRPYIRCVNGIRLGFVSLAEQPLGAFNARADILHLAAYDRVRMLLSQCDHVIVLVHSGPSEGTLPLPEWRERYRRFVDAGASVVVDTGRAKGWESYQNGLVFYGLGSPAEADSLGIFLTLQRNGRFSYEACALQYAAGTLDFSSNDAFRAKIDAQNRLFTDETAYLRAADDMCEELYCKSEPGRKRGVLGLFSQHTDEEQRLLSLLENESLRLMTLRALRRIRSRNP